jgi:16S rRNA (guanine527-N7)-methyltransferase
MTEALLAELERAHRLGFLGPQPAAAQLTHADALLSFAIDAGQTTVTTHRVADLGSGGGVPGLVGAVRIPGWYWFLVERGTTRARFLRGAARRLELTNVEIVAKDTEMLDVRALNATLVTARSYGAPELLAKHARQLLQVGGHLLVSDPPNGSSRWEGLAAPAGFVVVATSQTVSATLLLAV